jgi:hypothetical protein
MKSNFILTVIAVWLSGSLVTSNGEQIEDYKIEVQKLKEKMTELNNKLALKQNNEFGKGFSLGIPVGLFNEDWVAGFDCGYTFNNYIGLRFDIHVLGDRNEGTFQYVAIPTIGVVGKSPCISNFQVYGGGFVGITQELQNKNNATYFQFKGFGGIEAFIMKNQGFFLEAGGGGALTQNDISYTRGVLMTAGSRFYF